MVNSPNFRYRSTDKPRQESTDNCCTNLKECEKLDNVIVARLVFRQHSRT